MKCERCNGTGAIHCPRCFRGTDFSAVDSRCRTCNGIEEVQCPACHGRPIYAMEPDRSPEPMLALDKQPAIPIEAKTNKQTPEKRGEGGTHSQNLLAIYYLLQFTQVSSSNTRKASFASFLTGFSKNTLRQRLSTIHSKRNENGVEWEKDMRTVRQHFEDLGLEKVVHLIDADLTTSKASL
jgi:hypothetical protein